ncbi:hypothetical protein KC573_03205 [candidate division WWE3 bacterium]|uniref:Uncharacterized protein n=1 Tax=candidate division WWE3 bacterium TaxID=2053526 RepID=A0A955RX91_UNCKA|nr:hypothetical protein [candidate division WWE3 bacterium]
MNNQFEIEIIREAYCVRITISDAFWVTVIANNTTDPLFGCCTLIDPTHRTFIDDDEDSCDGYSLYIFFSDYIRDVLSETPPEGEYILKVEHPDLEIEEKFIVTYSKSN